MDRRERFNDPVEATRAALDGRQAEIWTAVPGIVQSFDPAASTVTVQPAIRGSIEVPGGAVQSVALPLLVDVPVVWPGAGGFTLTFPIQPGDECLVVFAARCIDAWWQSGGVQEPLERRMHDLSDGLALVGPRSQARQLPDINTKHMQLRTDDGQTYIEIRPDGRVRVDCQDLQLHARNSYSWDVDGYGQRLISKGAGRYQMHTWQRGAVFDPPIEDDINPPEGGYEIP